MKKIICLIMFAVFVLGINSCQKEKLPSAKKTSENADLLKSSSVDESIKREYDKNIRKFAKSLAKSLKHEDLRKMIKDKASLKVDGDYDIIWKNFNSEKVKTEKSEINLIDLIAENNEDKDKTLKCKIEEIEKFGNDYKKLQISVPLHCDEWDTENYTPLVTFVPSGFAEDWSEIEAFNSEGRSFMISVKDDPDVPVIVVGLNERSDVNGDILANYLKAAPIGGEDPPVPPAAPTSLVASSTLCYQIDLNWAYPSGTDVIAFNIYRKKYGDPSFVFLTSVASYQRNYYDIDVDDNSLYYYYIKALNGFEESTSSNQDYANTAQCPQPTDPEDLKIDYLNTNLLNLTWTNVSNETGYQIWQRIWEDGVLDSWQLVGTTGLNQTEYEVSNLEYAKEYYYKVYAYNENYTSAPSDYVIAYSTMRDIANMEVVGDCYFSDMEALRLYEAWVYGAPEMAVKVVKVDGSTGTVVELTGVHGFEPQRDSDMVYPEIYNWDHPIFCWDVRTAPIVVNWVWYEIDPDDTEWTINASVAAEIPDTGITVNFGVSVKLTANDDHITSQPVKWGDEIPKVYSNGYFFFELNNQ